MYIYITASDKHDLKCMKKKGVEGKGQAGKWPGGSSRAQPKAPVSKWEMGETREGKAKARPSGKKDFFFPTVTQYWGHYERRPVPHSKDSIESGEGSGSGSP